MPISIPNSPDDVLIYASKQCIKLRRRFPRQDAFISTEFGGIDSFMENYLKTHPDVPMNVLAHHVAQALNSIRLQVITEEIKAEAFRHLDSPRKGEVKC